MPQDVLLVISEKYDGTNRLSKREKTNGPENGTYWPYNITSQDGSYFGGNKNIALLRSIC